MIEERAVVVTSDVDGVVVTTPGRAGCARCAEGRGCGGGVLGRLTERRQQPTVRAANPDNAEFVAGDQVVIGLDDDALIGASLLVYVGPLVAMLGFALVAHLVLGLGEVATIFAEKTKLETNLSVHNPSREIQRSGKARVPDAGRL